jgi:hypothetical protein
LLKTGKFMNNSYVHLLLQTRNFSSLVCCN